MSTIEPAISLPPILDTHIHLYDEAHISNLCWAVPGTQLYSPHSVPEYLSCIPRTFLPRHQGFIFIETDCRYSDPPQLSPTSTDLEDAWKYVLEEYRFVYNLALEGNRNGVRVRGIVPWAPVHLGPGLLGNYLLMLRSIGGVIDDPIAPGKIDKKKSLLKGFRYLLQDKPPGTMLTENFVNGLKWICSIGLIFEIGIDTRSAGLWQLEELIKLLDELGDAAPVLVINHLCKPNLYIPPSELPVHPTFLPYTSLMTRLSSHPSTIMKLSGVFAELPPAPTPPTPIPTLTPSNITIPSTLSPPTTHFLLAQLHPWVSFIFRTFPVSRIIWGSDWPVCNVGYFTNQQDQTQPSENALVDGGDAWAAWVGLTELLFRRLALEIYHGEDGGSELENVWGKNGARVYGVELDEVEV